MRAGIEIGGTFTDLVAVLDDGSVETAKTFSTPGNPALGALDVLRQWRPTAAGLRSLAHGSTVATNAVLERNGAVTALLVTAGHRDVLEIQRHEKSEIFDLQYSKTVPLVPRSRVVEVRERLAASGEIVEPIQLDQALLERIREVVQRDRVASLAVTLLHSYLDPRHEQALGAFVAERLPGVAVTLSSQVNPEYREYERASTTVLSAFLRPVVDGYLETLERLVRAHGFTGDLQIMQSAGGVMPVLAAREQAVNVVLSGPAAGAVGAAFMASQAGFRDVITLDMGGTSADIALVRDGRPSVTFESRIDGLPIRVPAIDIQTVGAGGGSVAWIDQSGGLRVGPRSAGADPGPACYGRDGQDATTTDANLLIGLLRPARFFGGRLVLDTARAQAAVAPLCERLALQPVDVAEGIRRIANANMVEAIRLVSVERGHDPRDFALLAFGGAGGLHACEIAAELQIDTVIVPENQGVLSAFGLLVSDYRQDLVSTLVARERDIDPAELAQRFATMVDAVREAFGKYGFPAEDLDLKASVGLRYFGQASELDIPIDLPGIGREAVPAWVDSFHRQYKRRFGHSFPDKEVQLVNLRVSALRPAETLRLPAKSATLQPERDEGRVYAQGQWTPAAFLWRPSLPAGFAVPGPVVVEDYYATTYVPRGWSLTVQGDGTLVLQHRRAG
ncbi:MAG: hydantoinase/oxoprolinase family protein [Lautropia sp.]